MGFNSAFKGLSTSLMMVGVEVKRQAFLNLKSDRHDCPA